MPSLTSELFVRLIDGVTKPARAAANSLRGIGQAQTQVNKAPPFGDRMAAAATNLAGRLDAARGGMLEAMAVFYGLQRAISAPIQAAADFETQLEDIAQKTDMPRERMKALGDAITKVAIDTNQASSKIASAVDSLMGRGANEDVAMAAAAPIGKAATAYRAATDDLAAAAWAAVDNLKVPAGEITRVLEVMAASGKEGSFELKDMAKEIPSIAAQYAGMGQTGVAAVGDIAAALQIVTKGAGDASQGATNLRNVLQKMPAELTKKNFAKKFGINLEKEMKKAQKRGLTPLEAFAEIANKAVKGDLSKLGLIFEDAQAQSGLRSLIQNMEEYRRVRDVAMKSDGILEEDFQNRIRTAAAATERWNATLENLKIKLGASLLPVLNDTLDKLIPIINQITAWIDKNPELTAQIIQVTTALVGLRVALAALKWAGLYSLAGAFGAVGTGAKVLTRLGAPVLGFFQTLGLRARLATAATGKAPGIFALLGDAVLVAGRSFLKFPVGIVNRVAGLIGRLGIWGAVAAAAGLAIYENWEGLKIFFQGFGDAFAAAFEPVQPAIDRFKEALGPLKPVVETITTVIGDLLNPFGSLSKHMGELTGYLKIGNSTWAEWGVAAGAAAGKLTSDVINTFANWGTDIANKLVDVKNSITGAFEGIDIAGTARDLATRFGNALLEAIRGFASQVAAAIRGLFSGVSVSLPDIRPPGVAAGDNAAALGDKVGGMVPPPRAQGGPVAKGKSYWVGEHGRKELFTPGQSGRITPLHDLPKPIPGGGRRAQAPAINFRPSFSIGKVVGVEDLESRLNAFADRMQRDFEHAMAGSFSDPETA